MTYEELSARVAMLVEDDSVEGSKRLLTATNLALGELYTTHAVTKTVKLAARGIAPVLYHRQLVSKNGSPLILTLPGNAYSFKIHGGCQIAIITADGRTTFTVESGIEPLTVKGIVTAGSTMHLFGGYTFTVYDFSVFDYMFSLNEEDIPEPGRRYVFDLQKIYGDFMSFTTPATDGTGNTLADCRLYDGKAEIDAYYNGEIEITYRRLPTLCLGEHAEEEVDLPYEYAHLFPFLVSSYMLNDINEKLALQYNEKYKELLSLMDSHGYRAINTDYHVTNGWA